MKRSLSYDFGYPASDRNSYTQTSNSADDLVLEQVSNTPQSTIQKNIGVASKFLKGHRNLTGLLAAIGTYGVLRAAGQTYCDNAFAEDIVTPLVAASVASCVGHQLTPNAFFRYAAVTAPPLLACYELAGQIKEGLDYLLAGTQDHVARPLDNPGESVANGAKKAYNWVNGKLGKPLEDAKIISPEDHKKGFLEGVLQSARDNLCYVRGAATVGGTYLMKKLTKRVRGETLRKWTKARTPMEHFGESLGLRRSAEAR
ncbi:MAG: hypothetical protein Q7R96_03560 [Nanoarchaeota archaeon]|nr:hypothetical protein [Nanoarchaeota archaeon]